MAIGQFSLIYWRTAQYEIQRADQLLDREAALMAAQTPGDLHEQMRLWATNDLRLLITAAGLFDADRHLLAGNLVDWPDLPADGAIREVTVRTSDRGVRTLRAEALPVPGGRILVIGRGLRDLAQLRAIVLDAIETALIPALVFSLLAGAWLGRRTLHRVGRMQRTIEHIVDSGLRARLPVGRGGDEMARLASSVNRMMDRLVELLDEVKGVGDDIAHDLRTPLSRVRAGLERAAARDTDAEALRGAIGRALGDLDQCFAVVTALLRIREIENDRRRAGFAAVDLAAVAGDAFELYEPVAEAAGVELALAAPEPVELAGDRGLLGELLANLVDNAIKFTPAGGNVRIVAGWRGDRPVLSVSDTGIGIPPGERQAVLSRFFRGDESRHVPGNGLGLSLASAVAHLHEAQLSIGDGPGGVGTSVRVRFAPQRRPVTFLHPTRPVAVPGRGDPVTSSGR